MLTSLRSKLIAIMLFLSLSLVAILVVLYYHTERQLYNEFTRQTAELSAAIRLGVEELSRKGAYNEKGLKAYLAQLNTKGVKEISLISSSDRVLASTETSDVGKWVTRSKKDLIFRAELGQPVTSEGTFYDVIMPVTSEGRNLGYIYLRMSTEDFSVFLRTTVIRRIGAALLICLVGIGLAIVLASWYTKPIERMAGAARRVAEGDLTCELPAGRKDEIGQLALSFNYMLGRLREDRGLREKLRRAEHLAGIGQFSRNIAHEIKNPLNFISLAIEHMQEAYRPSAPPDAERFESLLTNMRTEIERVSRFAESFLEFGKSLELAMVPTDVHALLRNVLELVAVKAERERVRVVLEAAEAPAVLRLDADFIRTCLYNILLNAFQAMPDGGCITLRTRAEGSWFAIEVSDTGVGASPETAARAFDPFFTTRREGIGLGLAFTKRVVDEHGGRVSFDSREGRGTTVTIRLPRTETEGA